MDELAPFEKMTDVEIYLATVTSCTTAGARIQLDGQDSAMTKLYKVLNTPRHLETGDRVVVLKISGTYVILGAVSLPQDKTYITDLPTTATTALIVARFNWLLSALRAAGIIG